MWPQEVVVAFVKGSMQIMQVKAEMRGGFWVVEVVVVVVVAGWEVEGKGGAAPVRSRVSIGWSGG